MMATDAPATPAAPADAAPAPDAAQADAPPSLAAFEAELAAAAGEAEPAAEPVAEPAAAPPAAKPPAQAEPEPAPTDAEKRARAILASATKKEADALVKAAASRAELIALAKASPQKFLAEAGLTVDQFLRAIQAEGEPAAEPEPKAMIQELRDRLDNAEKAARTKAAQAETDRLTAEIQAEVKASDKYPLVNAAGYHDHVTDLMIQYAERHCVDSKGNWIDGAQPLDRNVAAAQVEAHLASLVAKLQPPKPAASNGTPTSQRPGTPTLATLSPREAPPADDGLSLNDDDRLAAVTREIAQLQ